MINQAKRQTAIAKHTMKGIRLAKGMSRNNLGYAGEMYAKQQLERLGLNVLYTGKLGVGYDLLVNGVLKVEIKTALLNNEERYQFSLRKDSTDVQKFADVRKADIVILQCVGNTGNVTSFVMPTIAVYNNKQVKITSDPSSYAGKFAKYRIA